LHLAAGKRSDELRDLAIGKAEAELPRPRKRKAQCRFGILMVDDENNPAFSNKGNLVAACEFQSDRSMRGTQK
jgi:hypothetical protein